MRNQDWKLKYSDLKLKFHDSIDVAFRLGFEQGAQNAQIQQAQQAQAVAQQAQQPGQEGEQSGEAGQFDEQQASDGSELDQHIGTLESMLQKSDPTSSEALSLKKSLDGLKSFRATLKQSSELKKAEKAIASIGKAMSPFTMSKAATKNMSEPAKKALTMQEEIVRDFMKSIDEEQKKVIETATKTVNFEHLLKE